MSSSKTIANDVDGRFQISLNDNDVRFPLSIEKIEFFGIPRLHFLKSGGVVFIDIPWHENPQAINFDNIHAVKIFDTSGSSNLVPESIDNNYVGLFSWRNFDRVIVVEDEWDALCLEEIAKQMRKGVLPLSSAKESGIDLIRKNILSQMKEIIVWPGNLVTDHPGLFEDLDDSIISTVSSSVPRPKEQMSSTCLMDVLIRETGDVINLGGNMARSLAQSQNLEGSTRWTRFSMLNDIVGGLRKGELTLFSGHTGKGKTTFLSEYSIDLALNGAKTLWCSFEMKLESLQNMQAAQLCQMSPAECQRDYEYVQEKLGNLGILALNSDPGSMDPHVLLEKLTKLTKYYKLDHIIIDNMQFLIFGGNSDEVYMSQDNTIRMLRDLATFMDVHVTVICHPRKTTSVGKQSYSFLTEYDLSGRARSVQEADNVIILQTAQDSESGVRKDWIQVHKCRHSGLGKMQLKYNPLTKTYLQESDWFLIGNFTDDFQDYSFLDDNPVSNTVDICLPDRRVDRLRDFLDEDAIDLFLNETDT